MTEDPRITAAFITAIAAGILAVISATVAWASSRSAIKLKAQLDLDAQGYSHKLAEQAEQLKAQLQLELANVGIREQMKATLRLQLFQDDERRVTELMQSFRDGYRMANDVVLLLADPNKSLDGLNRARELSSALMCRGLLLPSKLLQPAKQVEATIRALAAMSTATHREFEIQQARIHDAMERLESCAAQWRDENIRHFWAE
jgi:hypothetical protein